MIIDPSFRILPYSMANIPNIYWKDLTLNCFKLIVNMSSSFERLKFNSNQFEYALSILETERNATVFTKRQNKMFRILHFSAIGLLIIIVVSIIMVTIIPEEPSGIFVFTILAIQSLLLISILISGLSVLPLIKNIRKRDKIFGDLGLQEAIKSPWKKERKKTVLLNIVDRILSAYGYILGTVAFIAIIIGILSSDRGLALFILVVYSLLANSLIAIGIFRRNKSRLKIINRLYESLTNCFDNAEGQNLHLNIPLEDYEAMEKEALIEFKNLMEDIIDKRPIKVKVKNKNSETEILTRHSLSVRQIAILSKGGVINDFK